MKKLVKVLKYIVPFWWPALLNIIFNIISVIFSLVSFTLFIPVLQMLFKTTKIPETAPSPLVWHNVDSISENFYYEIGKLISMYGELEVLMFISFLIVALFLLKNLFRYLAMFFLAIVRNGVVRDMRNELYYKILILPLSYFTEQRKGDIIARMTSDVQEVEWSIMSSLEMLFREPITLVSFIITLFIINPSLTLFVLILLPVSALLIGRIGRSLKRTSVKGQRRMGLLLSIIEETIGGLRIIKAFNAIDSRNEAFKEQNRGYMRLMVRLYRKRDLASPLSEFLGALVLVMVLWFGGRIVLNPDSSLDAATFLVYLGIFSQLIPPSKSMTTAIYNVQKGAASVERIEYVLNAEEQIVEKDDAKALTAFYTDISFQKVYFSYDAKPNPDKWILDDISIKIPKGHSIALVGPSGGGKSTLINLLPRFYDVVAGDILIDDIAIRDCKIDDLRSLMGIVTQDSILFNDSVKNNIAMGKPDASNDEIIAAAKVANAHEFILHFPDGYETNIGDMGSKLSGGQKQRISIARAVLKNPPILLLDEATSALDTESEKLVQDALFRLMENRTSIVIAHRLSTIRNADTIYVIEKGRIKEYGTHEDLLLKKGLYYKLNKMQSFA